MKIIVCIDGQIFSDTQDLHFEISVEYTCISVEENYDKNIITKKFKFLEKNNDF